MLDYATRTNHDWLRLLKALDFMFLRNFCIYGPMCRAAILLPICFSFFVILSQGVRYYENVLVKDGGHANPNVYCKLGHFHLLLEDYVKGRF